MPWYLYLALKQLFATRQIGIGGIDQLQNIAAGEHAGIVMNLK